MSLFRMNNLVRSCLCSVTRLRNCKYRTFPTSVFLPKRYQSSSTGNVNSVDVDLSEDFDYESESPYSNVDFEALANGDADKLKTLKVLQLEIDLMRQQGEQVPSRLKAGRWKDLLILSKDERPKYLRHLWVNEQKEKHGKEKAKERSDAFLNFKAEREKSRPANLTTSSPCSYELTRTTLFHRIYDTTINRLYHYKLLQAEWFGPKILIDCSYEPFMSVKNLGNCVKQLVITWSLNRESCNPYDLIFCNVNTEGALWEKFLSRVPIANDADGPVHYTTDHYLKLFPKERLVYLTPNCKESLGKFDPDDIYIIGAFVDTGSHQPLSLAKAKKEGLRMAKLPLDKYLHWTSGHKSLTINQVLAIFNDLKDGQTWPQAFRHVPKRKISASTLGERDDDDKPNRLSAEAIREDFRKNLVYDLLLKNK